MRKVKKDLTRTTPLLAETKLDNLTGLSVNLFGQYSITMSFQRDLSVVHVWFLSYL